MKKSIIVLMLSILIASSCAKRNDMEPVIKFKTTAGNIVVKLYPETPKHRDNCVKLVEAGYYDGVLFHRVIADFMIQAGDPDSRNAKRSASLGSGDVKYTIPAEIVYPKYYHKKGALAAARQGDQVNPERASSGAQFYFVQGRLFTDQELNGIEKSYERKLEAKLFQEMLNNKQDEVKKYRLERNQAKLDELRDSILNVVHEQIKQNPSYKFTEQQRNDYKTIGGTPHLDGEYTVFGEVIEGIEIVSNISKVKTGKLDRPVEDVRILSAKRIR
ncbi:MAG: peptidylprolyl isomerase [Paludibacter sp.]